MKSIQITSILRVYYLVSLLLSSEFWANHDQANVINYGDIGTGDLTTSTQVEARFNLHCLTCFPVIILLCIYILSHQHQAGRKFPHMNPLASGLQRKEKPQLWHRGLTQMLRYPGTIKYDWKLCHLAASILHGRMICLVSRRLLEFHQSAESLASSKFQCQCQCLPWF